MVKTRFDLLLCCNMTLVDLVGELKSKWEKVRGLGGEAFFYELFGLTVFLGSMYQPFRRRGSGAAVSTGPARYSAFVVSRKAVSGYLNNEHRPTGTRLNWQGTPPLCLGRQGWLRYPKARAYKLEGWMVRVSNNGKKASGFWVGPGRDNVLYPRT